MNIKELRFAPSKSWDQSREHDDSKYYTDGAVLLLRSACKRKPYKRMTDYSLHRVLEESLDRLFTKYENTAISRINKVQDPERDWTYRRIGSIAWMSGFTDGDTIPLAAQRVKLILNMIPDAEFRIRICEHPEWFPIEIHSNGDMVGLIMAIRL